MARYSLTGRMETVRVEVKRRTLIHWNLSPVQTLEVELVSRSDGVFELEDKNSHLVGSLGKIIHMGPCAVVRHGGLTILLTSKKLPPFDLGQWRSQGIDPEKLSMIGVKAAVGHRRAYDPIASATFTASAGLSATESQNGWPFSCRRVSGRRAQRVMRFATP